MIDISYSKQYLKDLKQLKGNKIFSKLKNISFEKLPKYDSIKNIPNLKKIKGHNFYYRIKSGNYRIGVKIKNESVTLMRILHRKDIYKYFP